MELPRLDGPRSLVTTTIAPPARRALEVGVLRRKTATTVGALMKDAETIETVNGLSHDKRVNGIFRHDSIVSQITLGWVDC